MSGWASVEGQSDYFASLKCLRKLFADEDNASVVRNMEIDPKVREACEKEYISEADQTLCIRTSMAALPLAKILAELRNDSMPKFGTPDRSRVSRTFEEHPAAQCRLDTYFNGSLCTADLNAELSNTDFFKGACDPRIQLSGARPKCWFAN